MAIFDYCVIGNGLLGSATARHLAMSGVSVVVVGPAEPANKSTHQGVFGSHYDEGRITRVADADLVWARLAAASIRRYREIEAESGAEFYKEVGLLMLAPDDQAGRHYLALAANAAAACGATIEQVDSHALFERHPPLGFQARTTGIFQPREAGHVSGRKMVEAQCRAAVRYGAEVVREEVEQISEQGDTVQVEVTTGRTIHARTAIVAAGAYSNFRRLLPVRASWQVHGRVVVLFHIDSAHRAALRALPAIIWSESRLGSSFYALPPVRYPDGHWYLKVGGGAWDHALETLEQVEDWFRVAEPREDLQRLHSLALEMIPALSGASWQFLRCAVTQTVTGYPYIARLSDRVVLAAGGNGAAAKSSDEIGRLAAIVASGRPWPGQYDQGLFAAKLDSMGPW